MFYLLLAFVETLEKLEEIDKIEKVNKEYFYDLFNYLCFDFNSSIYASLNPYISVLSVVACGLLFLTLWSLLLLVHLKMISTIRRSITNNYYCRIHIQKIFENK